MAMITEFYMEKGVTVTGSKGETWERKTLGVTVKMPDMYSELDFKAALDSAECAINFWLAKGTLPAPAAPAAAPVTASPQIPNFNPEELMKHEGWKAKKNPDGSYEKGSLSWSWDFADQFSKEVIAVLQKGPIKIDKYIFSLNTTQTLVSANKIKESKGAA